MIDVCEATHVVGVDSGDKPAGLEATVGDDSLHDECGIFGIWAPGRDVARMTYFALHALQHRGQESAGIAVGDGKSVFVRKDLGLVTQVFTDSDLSALSGKVAVGHVRYGTAGSKGWESAQPHLSAINEVIIALAHNGTLVNFDQLRVELINMGVPFRTQTDSEVAARLIGFFTEKKHQLRSGIAHAMAMMEGGYAMALIRENALYAFRDPRGIRPLCLGKLPGEQGWCVASETCALDIVGAEYVRDVRPGEIIRISDDGISCEQVLDPEPRAECIFEHVYFARLTRTLSLACRIPACRPRRALPTSSAFPLERASSRTATSPAPSSSPRRSCARWAFGSSSTPLQTTSLASASSSSTTRSCAVPPPSRSFVC